MMRASAFIVLPLALLAGCGGHQSTTKNNSKSASSTSKDTGKVYTPDAKGPKGAAPGAGNNAPLPEPADTVDSKASAASDAGSVRAVKGQVVMTPGAPVAHPAGKPAGPPKQGPMGH